MREHLTGQFTPGTSILHRLDARAKFFGFLILIAATVCTDAWLGYALLLAVTAAVVAVCGLPLRTALASMARMGWFFLLIFVMNALFFATDDAIWHWWILTLSVPGIVQGAQVTVRLALILVRGGAANHPEAGVCDQYTCCCARKDDAALREQWGADYARNMARIRQAVTDTDGQYLTYGGQLIRAVFHASSAGATESSAALWSGDAPYLVSVSSPETAQDVPNYVSTAEIAADAVRAAVLDSYPDCVLGDDPGTWFGTPVLDDSGRVAHIPVGSETLTGAQVRALFSLRSAAFSVAYGGGTFTFTVTGSGHGVGMSQYGANVMALRGSGYADILAHYYPGTTLIRAEE